MILDQSNSQSAYFFANIDNVSVIVETISLGSGEVNAMIKGFVYIRNRETVRGLLIALQRNVDQSRYRCKYVVNQIPKQAHPICRRIARPPEALRCTQPAGHVPVAHQHRLDDELDLLDLPRSRAARAVPCLVGGRFAAGHVPPAGGTCVSVRHLQVAGVRVYLCAVLCGDHVHWLHDRHDGLHVSGRVHAGDRVPAGSAGRVRYLSRF